MQKKWYVLFVRTGEEQKISEILCSFDLDSFIPKMKKMHKKQGEVKFVERVMFPGYVFIESEEQQNTLVGILNEIRMKISKQMKLLKFDNEGTSALREEEQVFLNNLLNESKMMEHSIGFIEGDKTIVTEGPLKGMENTIVKIDRHKRIAIIEVTLCNQPQRIQVSLEIVHKVV